MSLDESRLQEVMGMELKEGAHPSDRGLLGKEMCVMEAVAYVAREEWSDHPACACRVLTAFALRLNDRAPAAQRQLLKSVIPVLVDSRAGRSATVQRAYRLADWALRKIAPRALERAKATDLAQRLRALGEVTRETASAAASVGRGVADEMRRRRRRSATAYTAATAATAAATAATAAAAYDAAAAAYTAAYTAATAYTAAYTAATAAAAYDAAAAAYDAAAADAAAAYAAYDAAAYAAYDAAADAWREIMEDAVALIEQLVEIR